MVWRWRRRSRRFSARASRPEGYPVRHLNKDGRDRRGRKVQVFERSRRSHRVAPLHGGCMLSWKGRYGLRAPQVSDGRHSLGDLGKVAAFVTVAGCRTSQGLRLRFLQNFPQTFF